MQIYMSHQQNIKTEIREEKRGQIVCPPLCLIANFNLCDFNSKNGRQRWLYRVKGSDAKWSIDPCSTSTTPVPPAPHPCGHTNTLIIHAGLLATTSDVQLLRFLQPQSTLMLSVSPPIDLRSQRTRPRGTASTSVCVTGRVHPARHLTARACPLYWWKKCFAQASIKPTKTWINRLVSFHLFFALF